MTFEELTPGRNFVLPVRSGSDPDSQEYTVYTSDGYEFKLRKFPFQMGRPVPDKISCRVIDDNGEIKLGFNLVPILKELYKVGEVYEFPVKTITGGGRLVVEDANKLFFKVQAGVDAAGLRPGDKVRCRFTTLEGIRYTLKLDERSFREAGIPMVTPQALVEQKVLTPAILRWGQMVLRQPALSKAKRKLADKSGSWLLMTIEQMYRAIPEWLQSSRLNEDGNTRRLGHTTMLLQALGSVARYMLDGSGLLRGSQRRQAQQRELTEIVQGAEAYMTVAQLMAGKQAADNFIADLLKRLKDSGYLFQPAQNFLVLMTLFRSQPQLVGSSMGKIFDAILSWEADNWKVEPFRSAFVEQLELFISENRRNIDNMSPAETMENGELIIKVVTALAIQSIISLKDKDVSVLNQSGNRALFFRYLTLLRKEQSEVLLEKAWLAALGVEFRPEYDWSDTRQLTMLITKASVGLDAAKTARYQHGLTRSFVGETCAIEVSPGGVSLRALNEYPGEETTWPAGLLDWHNLHITTREDIGVPNHNKAKDLKAYDKMWGNIERLLFMPETAERTAGLKLKAEPGDKIRIRITETKPGTGRQVFMAASCDDSYVHCTGELSVSDIVPYNVRMGLPMSAFCDPDTGVPFEFEAVVKAVNKNDYVQFSLSDPIYDYLDAPGTVVPGEETTCVVTSGPIRNRPGTVYSVVSQEGYTMFASAPDGMEQLESSDIVTVAYIGRDSKGNMLGEVKTILSPGVQVDTEMAVTNLLQQIGEPSDSLRGDDNDEFDQEVSPLSVEQVRELINIIRLRAVGVHDAVKANNFLAYAGCMASIIGDKRLEDICRQHRKLLSNLQYFVVNKELESDWKEQLDEQLIFDTPVLHNIYRKLDLISYLGQESLTETQNKTLMKYVSESSDETMAQLSRLVMSHMMLSQSGMTDQLGPIHQKLRELLNINVEEHTPKFYFDETQYTEFKSSYVFTALKKGQTRSLAAPELQETEIMSIICGFLNSTGGTLYLGVNNFGYECGLEQDLAYLRMTIDNLNVRIDNTVRRRLGANSGNYVRIHRDTDATRDVLAIHIEPSPSPVRLDNKTIFVRQSTSTIPMLGEEETKFIAERDITFEQASKANRKTKLHTAGEIDDTPAPVVKPAVKTPVVKTRNAEEPIPAAEPEPVVTDSHEVLTDRYRPNVQHDYEEGYTPVAGYIYFVNDNEFRVSRTDLFEDTNPDTRLALAITPEESDGQLLLAYDGALAVRVPMRELFGKDSNKLHRHASMSRLRFAAPINRGDALLTVHTDSKYGMYYRVTPYDDIMQGNINSSGQKLLTMPCADTVAWAVIPAAKTEQFADAVNVPNRSIGRSLRAWYNTPDAKSAIETLLEPLANN